MPLDTLLAFALVLQGAMGGVDTILNHEYLEHLPQRPEARREIGLHSMREAIYAVLFGGLGWFAWHGAAAYVLALARWVDQPTALVLADHGWPSWALLALATAAAAWSVLDFVAWRRLSTGRPTARTPAIA